VKTSDLFRLDGRVALITGAAGHLGRAMSRALAEAGAHVILNGRDESRLRDFEGELEAAGLSAEHAAFDVTDPQLHAKVARYPRLDIIVNNAVTMTPKGMSGLEASDFEETYRSAVTAAFEIVRAALPALRAAVGKAGEASIINVSSMYGAVAPDARVYSRPEQASPLHYGPAKAALLQLTRHLAAELGHEKIRVNSLMPGPFPHRRGARDARPALVPRQPCLQLRHRNDARC
jgi:NAD(P)-dependent dehydrogenase (short-subunit alcohol dehydrogenase family)